MPAGNIADITVAAQTTKGTAAATPGSRTYLAGGGIGPERTVVDLEETTGTRLRNTTFASLVRAAGTPEFWARPEVLGWFLWAAMGGKAVSGAADPWTHTFTLATTQPFLTLWRMLGAGLFERFLDCKVQSLMLSSQAGQPLRVAAGLVGITPQSKTAAEATATPETTVPFLHMDGKGAFLVEGVAASSIQAVRLSIATGVDAAQGDGLTPDSVNEGMFDITLETDQIISDFALWNRWHYGLASPADNAAPTPTVLELGGSGIDFKWSKRDAAGAVAAPERSLQATATRVQIASITGMEPNTSGAPLARSVAYRIVQPAGATSGLTAVLKNGRSAYAAS